MSTAVDPRLADPGTPSAVPPSPGRPRAWPLIATVVGMELRQRLRSRGWYVLLGVFFALVGLVTLGGLGLHGLTTSEAGATDTARFGSLLFDAVLLFVLTLSLLVSPALSANAISGDRAGGTLAITQVTLVSTGQLLLGKWLAAWIASVAFLVAALPWLLVTAVVGHVSPLAAFVGLGMILVEFAVISGIGVAVSAIAGRTLFAVVVTYLLVALLTIGSLVGFGLSLQFLQTTVQANQSVGSYEEATGTYTTTCEGPLEERKVPDPRRVGWLLVPNPYAVVADAVPWPRTPQGDVDEDRIGALTAMSMGLRLTQFHPGEFTDCVDGRPAAAASNPQALDARWPMWPLGLVMQGALLAGLLWWGHRRLDTPAGRLPTGTRVA